MSDLFDSQAWLAAKEHLRGMKQARAATALAEEALLTAATSSILSTGETALGTSAWREAFCRRMSEVQLADAMLKLNESYRF